MKISNLKTSPKVPFELDGRRLFKDNRTEIIHITLKPEEILKMHTKPFDMVFFVQEGKGLLITEEVTNTHERNSCVFVEKDIMRTWVNTTSVNLKLIAIKILT